MYASEEARRASQRRYLAGLRISYGNAISDCNMRSFPLRISQHAQRKLTPQQVHLHRRRLGQDKRVSAAAAWQQQVGLASAPIRSGTSNAFSWQLNNIFRCSLVGTPLSPPLKKEPRTRTWKPSPPHRVTWNSNLRQYDALQKRAQARAMLEQFLMEKKQAAGK